MPLRFWTLFLILTFGKNMIIDDTDYSGKWEFDYKLE